MNTSVTPPSEPLLISMQFTEHLATQTRIAELESALRESYRAMAVAFDRIHCLPRTSDSAIATLLEMARARIETLLPEGAR